MTSRSGRDYARMLFAGAEEGVPDKQGRIGIPPPLREYAALSRDVVVIGAMDRVEIWEPTRWREYSAVGPGEVRRARRGHAPQRLTSTTHHRTHRPQLTEGPQDEVSARSCPHPWRTFPGARRLSPC